VIYKKGISLIVLIITIITIIILAGAVILAVVDGNVLYNAKEARFKSDMKTFENILALKILKESSDNPLFDQNSINAIYNPQTEDKENILDVIPEVKGEYERKVEVNASKIVYSGEDNDEKIWTLELGMLIRGDMPVYGEEPILEADTIVTVGGIKHYKPNLASFNKDTTFYLTFNFGVEQKTSIKEAPPEDWYDYSQKKWANIVIENNGRKLYLVWIPRYAYKIQNYAKKTFSSTPPADVLPIDIRFVDKDNFDLNSAEPVQYNDTAPVVVSNVQTNFVTHSAFTVKRTDTEQENIALGGIWVSKFEATDIKVRLDSFKIDNIIDSTTIQVTTVPNAGSGIVANSYEYYVNDDTTPIKIGHATETLTGLLPNSISTITVKAKDANGIYTAPFSKSVLMIADSNVANMNAPDLTGFNLDTTYYLTFSSGVEVKTSIKETAPSGWYDYSNKRWANIITENNGKKMYLVWIPRYEYRIHTLQGSNFGQMDIQFIKTDKVVSSEGYTIHPAFSVNRSDTSQGKLELPGIWVSKFEATEIKAILNAFAIKSVTHNSVTVAVTPSPTGGIDPNTYEYYVNESETPIKIGTANETITGLDPNTVYTMKVRAKSTGGFYTAFLTRSFTTLQSPAVENAPDLTGFNQDTTYYITYSGSTEVKTSIKEAAPSDWYNYSNKQWANILTENNGRKIYLVWIPRYEYRVNTLSGSNFGQMDIQFIGQGKTEATSGYIIHPSFIVNRSDTTQDTVHLTGIWVSKFEATDIKLRLTSITITPQTDGRSVKTTVVTPTGSGVVADGYEYYLNDDTSPIKVGTASETITGLLPNTIYTIRVRAKDATGNYTAYLTKSTTTLSAPDATVANVPDLTRFNKDTTYYITYSGSTEVKTSINQAAPSGWYDYNNKQWANILCESNGKKIYLVWIPRYEYQIQTVTSTYGLMDIRFIATTKTVADTGYIIHPAFTVNRDDTSETKVELSGIWVSKFEATEIKAILNAFAIKSVTSNSVTVAVTPSPTGEIDPNTYEYYINDAETPIKIGSANETITGLNPNTIYTIKVRAKNTGGFYTAFLTKSFTTLQSSSIENAPDLSSFNHNTTYYITYSGGTEVKTSINQAAPSDWYNYTNKQWANILCENNGKKVYLVWIPRYEYRINTLEGSNFGQMDIQFISQSKTVADSGYIIHPAFSVNRDDTSETKVELSGIWVSKFEATEIKAILNDFDIKSVTSSSATVAVTPSPTGEIDPNTYEYYINESGTPIKIGTANETITGLNSNTIYTIKVRAKSTLGNYTAFLTRSFVTTSNSSTGVIATPSLVGFNANTTWYLTYENGVENLKSIKETAPSNWYDYDNKQWANIVCENNGKKIYLVWIPRYEYKVQNLESTNYGQIDIKFIPVSQTTADSGYIIHPAFKVDLSIVEDEGPITQISGVWVSKFEATDIN
jgi:hypothetical protein